MYLNNFNNIWEYHISIATICTSNRNKKARQNNTIQIILPFCTFWIKISSIHIRAVKNTNFNFWIVLKHYTGAHGKCAKIIINYFISNSNEICRETCVDINQAKCLLNQTFFCKLDHIAIYCIKYYNSTLIMCSLPWIYI